MDLLSDVHTNENRLQGSLTEVCCNDVSGRDVFTSRDEGHTFSDVQQSKHGHYGNLLAFRMSELTKLGSLESISMRTLFSVVSRGFDESIQKTNQDIPQHAASALKLFMQEIEQRVSKQAKDSRKQSNLYKSREDGYKSRVRALETLASGTIEENEVVKTILEQLKIAKNKIEEKKKLEEQDLIILRNEKHICEGEILSLKEELMSTQKAFDESRFQLEAEAKETKGKLQKKILELEYLLADSRKKVRDIEDYSESKFLQWKRKERGYRHFIDSQFRSLQELRSTSESIKQEVVKIKNIHAEEFHCFGANLRGLIDAAENYNKVLEENRKLYNQVQDLKGNIRVYCRIRPFLPGQSEKQTTIQYIGENGELVVVNPLKPGKDSHRVFKFNKVFGPSSTQEEVFHDTQPLIRSVLDGYSVCIFAYGQTGSGKTYTMSGPNVMSVVDWGVNYRALNDLFNISQQRHSAIAYEISVQMVEIYNEQVRDLLCNDSSRKRLGIWNTAQPNGLAVPDASMHAVKSTTDVLELMNIGLMNRAVGATALNERSSRSHSILTVHVRGLDLETNAILRGCLHLVDLAGSERVERSESLGDRLREAQNINKSLSALGDVIFALAQKSPHVPFRNSKLTQVLQTSLGGQAKTLMFVQLNPDVKSYSETVSTLKFAERVSGVELGAAQSNKEGRSVRELMEQVSSLKDLVTKKDEEIRQLRLLKTVGIGENSGSLPRRGSESPTRHFTWEAQPGQILSGKKISIEKAVSDLDNSSEHSDKHSETGFQQFMDEFKQHKGFFQHSRRAVTGGGENFPDEIGSKRDSTNGGRNSNANFELSGFEDADSEEKLSDESSGVLSVERETDASIDSFLDNTRFSETGKQTSETIGKLKGPYKPPMPQTQQGQVEPSQFSLNKSSSKFPSSKRATTSVFPPLSLPKDGSSKSQVTSTLTTKKKNFH